MPRTYRGPGRSRGLEAPVALVARGEEQNPDLLAPGLQAASYRSAAAVRKLFDELLA